MGNQANKQTKDRTREEDGAHDSTFYLMCRLKGGVIVKIWQQVLFILVYTTAVVLLHNYVGVFHMNFPHSLISLLGVVTGLLLGFRTNSAYDRYWEGRKIWAQMTQNIRTLSRCIWTGAAEEDNPENAQDLIEKLSIINLLVAFPFAVKNYLREEYAYDDGDQLKKLINHLPRFATPSSTVPLLSQDPSNSTNRKSTDLAAPATVTANKDKKAVKEKKKWKKALLAHDYPTPTNIPIEISYYISSYLSLPTTKKKFDPMMSSMSSALTSMIDCLTTFERIVRTPIPLAYSVHLHHSLWVYLLALPYQLIGTLNWWTIAVVTIASFALLGILAIGKEIENPFGTDYNDLPLDDFCYVIQREVYVMVGRTMPSPETWMMSGQNHPLAPASALTAEVLSTMSVDAIRDEIIKRAQIYEPLKPPSLEKEDPSEGKRKGELLIVTTSLHKQRRSPAKSTGSQGEEEAMLNRGGTH